MIADKPNNSKISGPCELTTYTQISENTLKMIDSSMKNLEKGIISETIELSEFKDNN